jgi:pimeloyl-ACP methyl ester carboxylesterase
MVTLDDGRTVGYAEFGSLDGRSVLWCHGEPGSRLEAEAFAPAATEHGLRIIGIDRPGYGLSSPRPGRSIVDWSMTGLP